MKNKTKLKKALNKVEQPFLIQSKSQLADSKSVYQVSSESQKADSGRSIVEMLGVLAVVGVLSVGGILGYKYAMNKYQANQIVNELNLTSSQMAIMLMRPHTADFELSLGEPYDDGHIATNALAFDFGCGTGAAEEDANCAADDIEYFSEVQGLPKEVCQNLVQLAQSLPYLEEVLVNDVADTTGALCADNSTVRCLFNADRNALIDDNPDPEVTDTETDENGCGINAYYDGWSCLCDEGWYNPTDGNYYETNEGLCTLSQEEADKKYCNGTGSWDRFGCTCINGVWDYSNNYCRDNGGCCKKGEISTIETITLTPEVTDSFTPEISDSYTPEVTVSGDGNCDGHGILSDFGCSCDAGWYDSAGKYYQASNCSMNQKAANQKFCNGKGQWARSDDGYTGYGIACRCNNGTTDSSNNNCQGNGGCCKNVSLCTSNSNCKSGEYCYTGYAYSCSQEFGGSTTSGGCLPSSGTTKEISGLGSVTKGGYMTWWSAERFCQSIGKQMVSLADLGRTTTIGTAGCKDSQIVKDLKSAFDSYYIWTSDQAGNNCSAYKVYLNDGDVYTSDRNYSSYALCK